MTPAAPSGTGGGVPGRESPTYEELVEALEDLTRRMADGAVGIEEAVELYEQAGRLHAQATERLAQVQARIDRLAGGDGVPPGPSSEHG